VIEIKKITDHCFRAQGAKALSASILTMYQGADAVPSTEQFVDSYPSRSACRTFV
jgi:hypothetical protein